MNKATYDRQVTFCEGLATAPFQDALSRICKKPGSETSDPRPFGALVPVEVTQEFVGGTKRTTPSMMQHLLYTPSYTVGLQRWYDKAADGDIEADYLIHIATILKYTTAALSGMSSSIPVLMDRMTPRLPQNDRRAEISCVLMPGAAVLTNNLQVAMHLMPGSVTDENLQEHIDICTRIVIAEPQSAHERLQIPARIAAANALCSALAPLKDPRSRKIIDIQPCPVTVDT
jgi:hypothetical protein